MLHVGFGMNPKCKICLCYKCNIEMTTKGLRKCRLVRCAEQKSDGNLQPSRKIEHNAWVRQLS